MGSIEQLDEITEFADRVGDSVTLTKLLEIVLKITQTYVEDSYLTISAGDKTYETSPL